MSKNNRKQDIQKEIENILRTNSTRSYSKEEIINLMSSDNSTQKEIEKTLGEMEVWSLTKDPQVSVYSSCKAGTVYFQWGRVP
jgi:hypothetical protein